MRNLIAFGLLLAAPFPALAAAAEQRQPVHQERRAMMEETLVGMWVTADGHIRLELLPDGRYDEARGARQSAYTGRWELRGEEIHFADDSGFTATGRLVEGVLTVGPDRFRRE